MGPAGDAMAVFICYRRDDTEGEARALHTRLLQETSPPHVFLDHDTIEAGQDWRARIDEALAQVQAAVIVIGPRWAGILQDRAASGQADIVRAEAAACLARPGLLVVPVLVKGATLPAAASLPEDVRALTERNAMDLRGASWKDDTARLVKRLRSARALPVKPSTWAWRGAALAMLPLAAAVLAWARVPAPAVPQGMTPTYARPLVEAAGLRFASADIAQATFGGYVVSSGPRGLRAAAQQSPAAGTPLWRWQTVRVDFLVLEPYRLVCRGGGPLATPLPSGDRPFIRLDTGWSATMPPGGCAWVTGPVHPNQMPVLRPLGFGAQLDQAFARAPAQLLVFCAYSQYDLPGAQRAERMAAMDFRQFLTTDDAGRLVPTVAGHVCDDKL